MEVTAEAVLVLCLQASRLLIIEAIRSSGGLLCTQLPKGGKPIFITRKVFLCDVNVRLVPEELDPVEEDLSRNEEAKPGGELLSMPQLQGRNREA